MVKIESLSRSFGDIKAVDNLSFEVRPNEIFALLGPNGAGKTTAIKMILGMLRPDAGTVQFNGSQVSPDDNSYLSKIGYVPESCALYENLTGREYLEFIGNLHHLPESDVQRKTGKLLDILELGEAAGQLLREYSKGMKQKILIISALLHDPDLIILDEPFSGLDANAVSVFKELFREQSRQGKAVIFCSHILEVVERLVDRILIIKDGKELASGTPEKIIEQAGHENLGQAFNELTGAKDIGAQARNIVDIIGNNNINQKMEGERHE